MGPPQGPGAGLAVTSARGLAGRTPAPGFGWASASASLRLDFGWISAFWVDFGLDFDSILISI